MSPSSRSRVEPIVGVTQLTVATLNLAGDASALAAGAQPLWR